MSLHLVEHGCENHIMSHQVKQSVQLSYQLQPGFHYGIHHHHRKSTSYIFFINIHTCTIVLVCNLDIAALGRTAQNHKPAHITTEYKYVCFKRTAGSETQPMICKYFTQKEKETCRQVNVGTICAGD